MGKLKLKWAFGIPSSTVAYGQPTIADGRLFFGTQDGTVYAVDARSGCTYWTFKAAASVRSAITIEKAASGRYVAYFGDLQASAYAIDAQNGELLWKTKLDTHPVARITASPKLYAGRVYFPISSVEEVPAGQHAIPVLHFPRQRGRRSTPPAASRSGSRTPFPTSPSLRARTPPARS